MNMACTSGRADLITVPNANEKVFTVRSKLNFTMECFDGRKIVADFQWVYQKGGTSNISKVCQCSSYYISLFQEALEKSCTETLTGILEN